MPAPVIAVALGNRLEPGRPPHLVQHRAYFTALSAAGAIPMGVPLLADPDQLRLLHERCDALLLPGGPDVDPARYRQSPQPGCDVVPDPELDSVELQLLDWALAADRPVLGICRGLQLLNVALGGTLWQDLGIQRPGAVQHRPEGRERFDLSHAVSLEPSSRLGRLAGAATIEVNSLHHQGVRELGAGLSVAGRSSDGLVEAVEMPGKAFVIAVQSHPEELGGASAWPELLFAAFVEAAAVAERV